MVKRMLVVILNNEVIHDEGPDMSNQ
jgi:hypothetical protein